jgi:hypothetical protein
MNLLERAKSLIENGRLCTAAVIAVAPLASATAEADIYIPLATTPTYSNYEMDPSNSSGSIDSTLNKSYADTTDTNRYTFSLNIGGSGASDAAWFAALNNTSRKASFYLQSSFSGSVDAGQQFSFNYTLSTQLSTGSATSVNYSMLVACIESNGLVHYITDSEQTSGHL